jgi:hypothetical protein
MENISTYVIAVILGTILILLIRSDYILMILICYVTIEHSILMMLSGVPFLIGKYYIDVLIMVFMFKALYTAIKNGRIVSSFITGGLCFLLVVWAISTAFNGTPILVSLVALRTVGRYIFLYLAMINLDVDKKFIVKIVTIMIIAGLVQVVIAAMQLGSPELQEAMKPPLESEDFIGVPMAGTQILGGMARVFGTMGRFNNLGFFLSMLSCLTVALYVNSPSRPGQILYLFLSLLFIVFVGFTVSRMAFGTSLAALIMIPLYAKRKRWLCGLPVLLGALIIFLLVMHGAGKADQAETEADTNIIERMLGLSSEEYTEREITEGRYYVLTEGILQILRESPLYGLGPGTIGSQIALFFDYTDAYQRINVTPEVFAIWSDIGWSTYIGQIGLLGTLAILLIFYKLFSVTVNNLRKESPWYQNAINQAYLTFIISFVFIWMFYSNALEFRIYAFFFWLFTAIMVINNKESIMKNLDDKASMSVMAAKAPYTYRGFKGR